MEGNVIVDTYIKPSKKKSISNDATAIHSITMDMLKDAPTFIEFFPKLWKAIKDKSVLIYNGEYDGRLMLQTAEQDDFKMNEFDVVCMMRCYSIFKGNWDEYHKRYRYQKLPKATHNAVGDCQVTLKLINKMARMEMSSLPKKKWWQF